MKLLVISDTHGDSPALEQAVKAHPDADAILFLGDGIREVEDLQDEYPQKRIYAVRGNCDYASFAPADGLAAFDGVLFYYTHGNMYEVKNGTDDLAAAAHARGADVALFGHTHLPECCRKADVTLFNPGSLSRAYGRGSYGVITIENGMPQFAHVKI